MKFTVKTIMVATFLGLLFAPVQAAKHTGRSDEYTHRYCYAWRTNLYPHTHTTFHWHCL